MTRTVSSADPRDRKALTLLAQAPTWTFGTRKADGLPFAIVPATTPGATYFTSAIGCTCPDHRARGGECKHMRAYCLYRLQQGQDVRPAAPAPKRATCRVCTQELPVGVLSGVCADCQDVCAFFEGVAAIKAAFGAEHPADVVRAFGT